MQWPDRLIRVRYVTAAVTLLLGAYFLWAGRHVTYEQSIKSFFASDDPAILQFDKWAEIFGYDNILFICYDDPDQFSPEGLERVAQLAQNLKSGSVDGLTDVRNLAAMPPLWQLDDAIESLDRLPRLLQAPALSAAKRLAGSVGDGGMTLASLMNSTEAEQRSALAEKIRSHPFFERMFTSRDGLTVSMIVQMKPPGEYDAITAIPRIREIADNFAKANGLERVAVVGPPSLLADGFIAIEEDGRRLARLGLVLIGLVMLLAVRSVWWTLVPIVAGYFTWMATEWILVEFGLKISLSGGPLIGQIIVLTMPAASHLALHFRDEQRQGLLRREAARKTLLDVIRPILWCAFTGAIGYGALTFSSVEPVRQFGMILGSCTLIAALWTTALAPFAMMPPRARERSDLVASTSPVAGWMRRLTDLTIEHPMPVIVVILALVLPIAAGIFRLSYESNYVNMFRPQSRIVSDYGFVERRLDGIGQVSLIVPTPPKLDARTLAQLNDVTRQLEALGSDRVVKVLSVATVMDPTGRWSKLPADRQDRLLATKSELIAASPQASALRQFWNGDAGFTRFIVRVPESSPNQEKIDTFQEAQRIAASVFGPATELTGLSLLMSQIARSVINTQWSTFLISSISILCMLTLAFRRISMALLAMAPTLLSVGLVLGLMGRQGHKLDMGTALVASVALGLSVDDTFHCLLQFSRLHGRPFRERLYESYKVTGPGVVLSSFAVSIGFLALATSEFLPFSRFGVMVAIATAGSSIGNLLLLPACISVRAAYLQKRRLKPTVPMPEPLDAIPDDI